MPTYTYDNEGHLHVPPLQPGRLPPAISPPPGSEPDTTAAVAAPPAKDGNGLGNFFGGLFASKAAAEPANVASADANRKGTQASSAACSRRSTTTPSSRIRPPGCADRSRRRMPRLRRRSSNRPRIMRRPPPRACDRQPKVESHKTEPQQADAAKPKTTASAARPMRAARDQRQQWRSDQRRATRGARRHVRQPLGRVAVIRNRKSDGKCYLITDY